MPVDYNGTPHSSPNAKLTLFMQKLEMTRMYFIKWNHVENSKVFP